MAVPSVDKEACIACEACVEACPSNVIAIEGETAVIASPDDCVECGACVEECPTDALSM